MANNNVMKKIENRKLKKVIMEYDNGDVQSIEGEYAERWIDAINSAIFQSHIHGSSIQDVLKEIEWKKMNS